MKNLKIIIIILAVTVITSCSPKYYVPNTQNVPLISERGETNLTLSGNGNQVEFQGAYGVSDNIALQANAGLFRWIWKMEMVDPANLLKLVADIINR